MSKSVVEFRGGEKIPLFAIGTSHGSPREIGILLDFALTMGQRHFDVVAAPEIETVVGQVLSDWLLSGRIRRQEIYVTAKLPSYAMKSTRVKKSLLKSLLNLGLNYVDSYVMSSPGGQLLEIWPAMEETEEEGLTRALGVAHFSLQQLQKVRDGAKMKPQILHTEFHPFLQEKNLMDYCRNNKIQVVAVVPTAFTDHQTVNFHNPLAENKILQSMTKTGRNVEQVVFKWLQQKRCVILCENVTIIHLTKCLQIFNFELSTDQIKAIDRLDVDRRYYIPPTSEININK